MTPVHHAINYVEITVTDMDAPQHFYGTAFGWRPEREQARRMEYNLGNMRFRRSDQGQR
jgi:predicted enzyme related to lactoylglutathione lyase